MNKQNDQTEQKTESGGSQPYQAPELHVHGTVQELTQAIGIQGADGLTGSRL